MTSPGGVPRAGAGTGDEGELPMTDRRRLTRARGWTRGPARGRRRAATPLRDGRPGADHPRLARLLGSRTVRAGPGGTDPRERRKTALLRLAGGIVINLAVFGVLLHLLWRYVLSS